MKKIFCLFIIFIFITNIEAASSFKNYDDAVKVASKYINNFKDSSKYIVLKNRNKLPFIYKNKKLDTSDSFDGNGGLLNEEEYNIVKNNLYNGLEFWLTYNSAYKIVDSFGNVTSDGISASDKKGVRITVFVKKGTKVTGAGSKANPWIFVEEPI